MHSDVQEILFTEEQVDAKIREIGTQIARDYAGQDLLVIGILKGAAFFMAELVKRIEMPMEIDFMAVSSYGKSSESSGVVRIMKDLEKSIEGRHVLVVEDIVDSGLTLVLDQTAFYPTGGGQPCDLGTLNGVAVIDVEEVDGKVLHRLASPLPADVTVVSCKIDWERRFDHMQQHTGQHILSAAFEELFAGETIGFHLGRDYVTVDITLTDLTQEIVEKVELLANSVIMENRVIDSRFVEPEELTQMPLRKPPSVTENIRIVTVTDFDYSACGGTHPSHTGEVGPIKILNWERYKGNVRIEFVCGWRTLRAMTYKQLVLRQLSRQLTCGEQELPDNLTRVLNERKELDKALQEAKLKLSEAEASELLTTSESKHGARIVAAELTDRTMAELQNLARRITSLDTSAIALLISGGAKTQLVFARGADIKIAMNELIKETLPLIDGKGGGSADIAQGGGNEAVTPAHVLAHAQQLLESKLSQPA